MRTILYEVWVIKIVALLFWVSLRIQSFSLWVIILFLFEFNCFTKTRDFFLISV